MDKITKNRLIGIAKKNISGSDPSHDIEHALRVLALSEKIAKVEKADMDIIVPAALFHDIVNYPKNHLKRLHSQEESAIFTKKVLKKIKLFPKEKIEKVCECIRYCSFSKNLSPGFIEAMILQDADGLEAMGAISVMRTFSSAGLMKKSFYNYNDPFCSRRKPDDSRYALDLFLTRLMVIQKRLHTKSAKKMSEKRMDFLRLFLKELQSELSETYGK
ncbi:MAG TPA: phosphohydrolase [Candidatus Moranbacteria bacterium]|nr:phosphohydrolase [Candidatus Moranbacteria bacterium]